WAALERQHSRRELEIARQFQAADDTINIRYCGRFDLAEFDSADQLLPPRWWRRALSALCGPRIEAILASGSSLRNISACAELGNLEMLSLEGTHVRDLSPIARCRHMYGLFLNDTAISDLTPIARLVELERLDIVNSPVRDLSSLVNLKKLSTLTLDGTRVGD